MWFELIKDILGSPFGSFAFVFFVLLLLGWVIYKITVFTTTWEMKAKGMDKLETKVDTLASDISYIKIQLTMMNSNTAGSLIQSHSPISLTEMGKTIAEKMDISTIIVTNWEKIYQYVDSHVKNKNAYDIQQFCIETATIAQDKFFSEEDLNKIKRFAYNEGKPLGFYGGMIGVLIRDRYFQQKGINPSSVDECDVAKGEG